MSIYGATIAHEAFASAALAFTMNGATAVAIMAVPFVKEYYPTADAEIVTLTLVFLILSFFFSPLVTALGRGAVMNPAALTIRMLIGQMSFIKYLTNFVAIIFGSYAGVYLCGAALAEYPVPGAAIVAFKPAAPFWDAAAAEFGVTISMSFFHSLLDGIMPNSYLTGVVSAGTYCGILAMEKCAYSCSVMNPAAPIALQLYETGLPNFFTEAVWKQLGPYVLGSFGASLVLGSIFSVIMPDDKPLTKPAKKMV